MNAFEERLDEMHDQGRTVKQRRQHGKRIDDREVREVGDAQVERLDEMFAVEVRDVCTLQVRNSGIRCEHAPDLTETNVNGIDAPSPMLEQTMREPPGGRTGVEYHTSLYGNREASESRFELLTPSAHIAFIEARNFDFGFGGDQLARLRAIVVPHPNLAGHDPSVGRLRVGH